MKLVVNGECVSFGGTSVEELLSSLDVKAKAVAVEVNEEVVPRKLHGQTVLRENDRVEIVTLVGGG